MTASVTSAAERRLPAADEMYAAVVARDTRYDGIFFTAVRTTGIFCRPSCPARRPERRNVEFFGSPATAMTHGYRPCLRCRPLEPRGSTPEPIRRLLIAVEADPARRLRDADLRTLGLEPAAVRRWFRRHHGMTFHAYQRARRMATAIGELARGTPVTHAAFGNGYDSLSGFQDALRQVTGKSPARSRTSRVVHLAHVLTPLGPMLLGSDDDGICLLEFVDRRMLATQLERIRQRLRCAFLPGRSDAGREAEAQLLEYFDRTRRTFTVPLVTPGTDFQQRTWRALREIPWGTTRSYAEQARMIGAPQAVRAVARANGDNRIAIIIPCHRVIGADGRLTGYGGGLWRKAWLLHHEGLTVPAGGAEDDRQQELALAGGAGAHGNAG
jgi:AraC family transcriptional regulator, regulatory protein of adaptative response / methylated-DNA-[protein]-cysteine methyltransferase